MCMFKMNLLLETQPNEGKAKGDAINHNSETLGHAMLVRRRRPASLPRCRAMRRRRRRRRRPFEEAPTRRLEPRRARSS